MRGGNRGTVAYPLMQTEPPPIAQAIFLRSGTDVYGCLRMRHTVSSVDTSRVFTVQCLDVLPGSNALQNITTVCMAWAAHGISDSVFIHA